MKLTDPFGFDLNEPATGAGDVAKKLPSLLPNTLHVSSKEIILYLPHKTDNPLKSPALKTGLTTTCP